MKFLKFAKGGVHPDECKQYSRYAAITPLPEPDEVSLLLSQCIGAPSKPVVKVGDRVARGQIVAEPGAYVSSPIHSPIAGVVAKIENVRDISGYWSEAIIIRRDKSASAAINPAEADSVTGAVDAAVPAAACSSRSFAPISPSRFAQVIADISADQIIQAVADCGIVGLGGAAFPTHVKIKTPDNRRIDTLIINGAECEPYLTCDDRLMREYAHDIIRGALLLAKACRASKIVIAVESNKPEAIAAVKAAAADNDITGPAKAIAKNVEVAVLRTRYPQGSEKQLIQAVTHRIVPTGGLPADVNCIVDNVATAFAVLHAVCDHTPLTRRVVTVTGPELTAPGNFIAYVGMTYRSLIEAAGGLPDDSGKVISGGPMMGKAISTLDAPITKATGGIIVLPGDEAHRRAERPCIKCGRCLNVCPMGLEPYLLMTFSRLHLQQESENHGIMNCLECGCCSYACPSYRPLLDAIRLSKSIIRSNKKRQ